MIRDRDRLFGVVFVPALVVVTLVIVLGLGATLLGWAVGPQGIAVQSPGESQGVPPIGRTVDGPFTLEIQPAKAVFSSDEAVVVHATLTYAGQAASVLISHGHGSPMAIGVVEPVAGISMGAGWRLSCEPSILQRGVAVTTTFHKSGDSAGMSVPSFMAIINDPRMPAGTWHFYVEALFYEGRACSEGGPKHDIRAEVAVVVSPEGGSTIVLRRTSDIR